MAKVSSKDPRVQAAMDALRARAAARKSSNKPKDEKKKKKKKSPSLGSGLAENARRMLSGRGRQINKAVNKAVRGK